LHYCCLESIEQTKFAWALRKNTYVNGKKNLPIPEAIKDNASITPQEQQADLPQTVRRTIRLEEEIDSKSEGFCNTQKITKDNFIEAAFVVCSQNDELMQEILKEAKQRYHHRKQLGEQRKFQTMAKKMNSLS
jgi:hypothetical protein